MIHPENCSDDSVHAAEGANVNVNRFTLPKDPREWITAVALALSIAVNLWCAYTIRDIGTRKWLHDYDLNQFQMHEFRDVQVDVQITKELAKQALVSQQCKR